MSSDQLLPADRSPLTPPRGGRGRTLPRSVRAFTSRLRLAGAVLGLVALSSACISQTPAGTYFGSDPPGATLYVNGKESGFVTPCKLHLDEGDEHTISLELPGYLPAEFELEPALQVEFVGWGSGANLKSGLTTPTFLPFFDLVSPIRTNRGLAPGRIFVRLQPTQ